MPVGSTIAMAHGGNVKTSADGRTRFTAELPKRLPRPFQALTSVSGQPALVLPKVRATAPAGTVERFTEFLSPGLGGLVGSHTESKICRSSWVMPVNLSIH
jgi:hypothetical protein